MNTQPDPLPSAAATIESRPSFTPSELDLQQPYIPHARQILCHNILAAHNGESFDLSIIGAEPNTQLFFAHIINGLLSSLLVPSTSVDPHDNLSPIHLLSADMFDVLDAARKIAYRRVHGALGVNANSPYSYFPIDTLREFVSQSDVTLRHFILSTPDPDISLTPNKPIARSTILSYFNLRFGTAVALIESYPLSGTETVNFIDRERYFSTLDHNPAADCLI